MYFQLESTILREVCQYQSIYWYWLYHSPRWKKKWHQSVFKHILNIKGILSTSCVIFSYPKLLSISVLTFIKWRLTPSYAAKDTIFWQKRPKSIVIRIIVWMTIFKSIHMAFYVNTSWACALFRNNKQHVVLGQRETVNAGKKADFDGFRDKEE